jgi:uncharacterized protein (TIGR02246 family)
MPAQQPTDIHRLMSEALATGNREAALALYEPDAVFVPRPGQVAGGLAAIGAALDQFLALKPTLTVEPAQVLQAGDTALLRAKWTLTGTGPDGQPIRMAGEATDVARRQADGSWRYRIDQPWGAS